MDQEPSDDTRRQSGLTEAEAKQLLAQGGPNISRTEQIRAVFHIIAETLREPTFVLLLAAGGLYLFLGILGEGLFVCAGAVVSLGMVILQETRSEHALQALQALAEPEARVIRDGRERRIPSRELVPGDLMLISAGERIAADGRITSAGVVTIDESLLSGESVPVSKSALRTNAGAFEESSLNPPSGASAPFWRDAASSVARVPSTSGRAAAEEIFILPFASLLGKPN
jgi:Ca2+-transporting ATPase